MIKALNVSHSVPSYEGTLPILSEINLEIRTGESLAIIGASGSGKTTFLGMLAGLDVPTTGEIFLNDTEITNLSEEERALVRRHNVAFVFQNFQLLESLNALENVMLPLEVKGVKNPESEAKLHLERVGLAKRAHHYPQQLSGGEQQRVAIARAFSCKAPIIFADEPTGNLDTKTGAIITDLLFELNRESDTTLVMVTHSDALARHCERSVEMTAGRLDTNRD